jgi:hypothetical protein
MYGGPEAVLTMIVNVTNVCLNEAHKNLFIEHHLA